jgi:hypothetical protein
VKEIVEQAKARRAHGGRSLEEEVIVNVEKTQVNFYPEADKYIQEMKDELKTWVNNQKDKNKQENNNE